MKIVKILIIAVLLLGMVTCSVALYKRDSGAPFFKF
jgi:hypothetical protein